jgi:hypothetical protein
MAMRLQYDKGSAREDSHRRYPTLVSSHANLGLAALPSEQAFRPHRGHARLAVGSASHAAFETAPLAQPPLIQPATIVPSGRMYFLRGNGMTPDPARLQHYSAYSGSTATAADVYPAS